jgi:hypothetical protein
MAADRHEASIALAESLGRALQDVQFLASLLTTAEARMMVALANVAGD